MSSWETVIGLEVHVQLNTKTKLFCDCLVCFGASPNVHTCPVCMGHPGALPVLNQAALHKAALAGLSLGCQLNSFSRFDRKSYFYPDLPKGYQISQQDYPICSGGHLCFEVTEKGQASYEATVPIKRLHLEEDAGKLMHAQKTAISQSYVDLNRAGTPLIEIVCEPAIHTSQEAVRYLETLKQIMRYLDVSDCNMEEGSLRCDVNISLRKTSSKTLGDRTEIKNMNSFRGVKDAIDYEITRQTQLLDSGEKISTNTLLWDVEKQQTRPLRTKEEAHDYRYFPEPDLLPCLLKNNEIQAIQNNMVELPNEKHRRFQNEYGLSNYDASVLVAEKSLCDYYEAAVRAYPNEPKKICNWITTEILSILKEKMIPIEDFSVPPEEVGTLIQCIQEGKLSGKLAKEMFPEMIHTQKSVHTIIKQKNIQVLSDQTKLQQIAQTILEKHPDIVQKYKAGNHKVLGFLVGQAMQTTKGQANPSLISNLFRTLINSN